MEEDLEGLSSFLSGAIVEINVVDADTRLTALELACTYQKEASIEYLQRVGSAHLVENFHTGYLFATGLHRCPSITDSINRAKDDPIQRYVSKPSQELLALEMALLFPGLARKTVVRLLSFTGGLTSTARAAVAHFESIEKVDTAKPAIASTGAQSNGSQSQVMPMSALCPAVREMFPGMSDGGSVSVHEREIYGIWKQVDVGCWRQGLTHNMHVPGREQLNWLHADYEAPQTPSIPRRKKGDKSHKDPEIWRRHVASNLEQKRGKLCLTDEQYQVWFPENHVRRPRNTVRAEPSGTVVSTPVYLKAGRVSTTQALVSPRTNAPTSPSGKPSPRIVDADAQEVRSARPVTAPSIEQPVPPSRPGKHSPDGTPGTAEHPLVITTEGSPASAPIAMQRQTVAGIGATMQRLADGRWRVHSGKISPQSSKQAIAVRVGTRVLQQREADLQNSYFSTRVGGHNLSHQEQAKIYSYKIEQERMKATQQQERQRQQQSFAQRSPSTHRSRPTAVTPAAGFRISARSKLTMPRSAAAARFSASMVERADRAVELKLSRPTKLKDAPSRWSHDGSGDGIAAAANRAVVGTVAIAQMCST